MNKNKTSPKVDALERELRRLSLKLVDKEADNMRLRARIMVLEAPWFWGYRPAHSHELRKINELRDLIVSINRRLSIALGVPGAPPGKQGKENTMATIDEALEAVRSASTRTDSIIADRASLKAQLDEALANVKIPADVQAKIDEIFNIEKSDAEKIDAALNTNVPPPEPQA